MPALAMLDLPYVKLGVAFSVELYILGPIYSVGRRHIFFFGQAKLATWLMRRNKIQSCGPVDPVLMFMGFVSACLWTEWEFYRFLNDLEASQSI